MASFGAMTLYTGGVNRAEAAVDIVIGQVLAYDPTQKATLADATDKDLARPIGVSLTNTEAGGLCVFATSPAVFDSGNLTSQDQDDRFYVSHVPGEVCKFDALPDEAWLSIIAIPNISPDRFKLVLQNPDLRKSPCFLSSQDVPPKVAGLTAESNAPYTVELNWGAVSATCSVDDYTIYESFDGAVYQPMETLAGVTKTIESLGAGTEYFFKVSANNFNGEGELSDPATVTVALPPEVLIGALSVSGNVSPSAGSDEEYAASIAGNATDLSYQWVATAGTITSEVGNKVTVNWNTVGQGSLELVVLSGEENVNDSPQQFVLPVEVIA